MNISLTETKGFVLTGRNNDNSKFYIRPKSAFIREMELGEGGLVTSFGSEGWTDETEIMKMIDHKTEFYTYHNNEFTEVVVVDGHLKTVSNNTELDNIGNLPVIQFSNKK